jgi:hypothetical protein
VKTQTSGKSAKDHAVCRAVGELILRDGLYVDCVELGYCAVNSRLLVFTHPRWFADFGVAA